MHVNFYKKPQIKTSNTHLKIDNSVLFLDYLQHFISNSATKEFRDMEPWVWHTTPFELISLCFE